MKSFKKYLGTGLLVLLPISLSLYLIFVVTSFFDNILSKPLDYLIGFHIPGVGLIVVFLLVFFVGMFSSHFIGKKIAKLVEKIFSKIPVIRNLYSPIRDIVKTFIGKEKDKKSFTKVVWVEFPMEGSHSIGFITNEEVYINGTVYSAVFIPTTPNPTNGFLIYKKYEELKVLDVPVEQGLNMVISMSTVTHEEVTFKEEEK